MVCKCSLLFVGVWIFTFLVEISMAGPISNYGGYRADVYYIEASPRTPSESVNPSDRQLQNERVRRPQVVRPFSSSRRYDFIDDADNAPFSFQPPQRPRSYNRRPLPPRRVTPEHPESPTDLWKRVDEANQDGQKQQQAEQRQEESIIEALPSAEPLIQSNSKNKNNDDNDVDKLLGDFRDWITQESKVNVENFEYKDDEDFQTRTNFIPTDDKKSIQQQQSPKVDPIEDQALVASLNDKKCPTGHKRVTGGGCKPIIRV